MVSHLVLNDLFALWMKKHTQKRNKQEKEESLRPIVNITDFLSRWILYGYGKCCEITRSVKHMEIVNIKKQKTVSMANM